MFNLMGWNATANVVNLPKSIRTVKAAAANIYIRKKI